MSDSEDSDPEKSDSEELNFPPNGDPPKLGSSVTEDALLNEIEALLRGGGGWLLIPYP